MCALVFMIFYMSFKMKIKLTSTLNYLSVPWFELLGTVTQKTDLCFFLNEFILLISTHQYNI